MTPHAIRVLDAVIDQPDAYRSAALLCDFHDIVAAEGVTFHGMAEIGQSPLSVMLSECYGLRTTWSGFRLSPEGQEEPNYIHTDQDMGEWTGILYLHPEPPPGDGTTFWRNLKSGEIQSVADRTDPQATCGEWLAWRDLALWEPWHTVPSQFNRLLLFPSPYFHSRALHGNWGRGQDARLIQLVFGTGVLPCL